MMKDCIVPIKEAKRFVAECLKSSGGPLHCCNDLAEVLVAADTRGHFSHGLNRLEVYCTDYELGATSSTSSPTIEKQTVSTALVNGNNALGATVGKFCMELAIEKCKSTGVGVVTAKGSNHYGIAGFYGLMAEKQGLIGISMTNTSPVVVPTRAKQCTIGTNAISVIAPAENEDYFAMDMATSTVALGKLEVARRKGEPIPPGWGCDSEGNESLDPGAVLDGGGLLPLGGTEQSGGYKGYALASSVEVLCGILSGGNWGPHIRSWQNPDRSKQADLGQFFMALDPGVFGGGFTGRMQQFMDEHRALDPVEGTDSVLVAGDPERAAEKACEERGGILYHPAFMQNMEKLAKKLNVPPLKHL